MGTGSFKGKDEGETSLKLAMNTAQESFKRFKNRTPQKVMRPWPEPRKSHIGKWSFLKLEKDLGEEILEPGGKPGWDDEDARGKVDLTPIWKEESSGCLPSLPGHPVGRKLRLSVCRRSDYATEHRETTTRVDEPWDKHTSLAELYLACAIYTPPAPVCVKIHQTLNAVIGQSTGLKIRSQSQMQWGRRRKESKVESEVCHFWCSQAEMSGNGKSFRKGMIKLGNGVGIVEVSFKLIPLLFLLSLHSCLVGIK